VAASNGTLTVWSSYPGKLEARRVENILSRFNGSATIVEMAPEGTQVNAGDLLVRFDSSPWSATCLTWNAPVPPRRPTWSAWRRRNYPLEVRDLEAQLLEAQGNYESEFRYLEDSRQLVAEELVSPQELEQQKLKVEELKAKKEKLTIQLDLTKRYLHPNALARARATLAAAELELKMIRTQFSNCTVTRPRRAWWYTDRCMWAANTAPPAWGTASSRTSRL
jgi:multidrug resistance efflux pump